MILFEKRKRSNKGILYLIIAIAAVAAAMGVYFIVEQKRASDEAARIALEEAQAIQREEEARKNRYDAIMNPKVILDGVFIEGIDMGGLTEAEAYSKLQSCVETLKPSQNITLKFEGNEFVLNPSKDLLFTDNIKDLIQKALTAAQSDSMDEALSLADAIAQNHLEMKIEIIPDETSISNYVRSISEQLDRQSQNAGITDINLDEHTVTCSEETHGITVVQSSLMDLIKNAISNHISTVDIPVQSSQATSKSYIDVVFHTSFKGSTSERIFNIKKGAGLLNGTRLAPGETFSMNDCLGTRTESKGWKDANAYVSGTTEIQSGGGVCQISSTLYNAAVMSDLKIVSRRNHSMPVSYISKGLDATINSVGNIIDFKFSNNTGSEIVVFSWTEEKNLYVKICRESFDSDEYDQIDLTAEKIETLYPDGEMEVVLDPELEPGTEVIDVATQNGAIYQSYKNYYKNGTLVKTEKLALSTYRAFNGSKRIGPDIVYVDKPEESNPNEGTIPSPDTYDSPVVTEEADSPDFFG